MYGPALACQGFSPREVRGECRWCHRKDASPCNDDLGRCGLTAGVPLTVIFSTPLGACAVSPISFSDRCRGPGKGALVPHTPRGNVNVLPETTKLSSLTLQPEAPVRPALVNLEESQFCSPSTQVSTPTHTACVLSPAPTDPTLSRRKKALSYKQ